MEPETPMRLGVRNLSVDLRCGRETGDTLAAHLYPGDEEALITLTPITIGAKKDDNLWGAEMLWEALRAGEIDCALLELTCLLEWPESDIELTAFLTRQNPREGLLHKEAAKFAELPEGTKLCAESRAVRRQLAAIRPDIEWVDLAGDTPMKLHKVHLGHADGLIAAGSHFALLGFAQRAFEFLSMEVALPRPGQGVWGLFCRTADTGLSATLHDLDDDRTRVCALAELDLAEALEATPDSIGAWARLQKGKLLLDGVSTSGEAPRRLTESESPGRRKALVQALAAALKR